MNFDRNKLACRTVDSDYDFEGVNPSKYVVNTQPNVGTNPFSYAIDADTVRIILGNDILTKW